MDIVLIYVHLVGVFSLEVSSAPNWRVVLFTSYAYLPWGGYFNHLTRHITQMQCHSVFYDTIDTKNCTLAFFNSHLNMTQMTRVVSVSLKLLLWHLLALFISRATFASHIISFSVTYNTITVTWFHFSTTYIVKCTGTTLLATYGHVSERFLHSFTSVCAQVWLHVCYITCCLH